MYMNLEEFVFIICAVILAHVIMKAIGMIFKGIKTIVSVIKMGAKEAKQKSEEEKIKEVVKIILKEENK